MWSTVATAFKLGLEQLSVLELLAGASLSSLLVLGLFLLAKKELSPAFFAVPKYWLPTLILASFNPVFYYLVLFQAYDLLPAQIAQVLNYTWVISLTLLSIPLLKHKVTYGDIVAILLGYVGVGMIIWGANQLVGQVSVLGCALALLSTIIWALYWLISTRDTRAPVVKLFHSFLFATPMLFLLNFLLGDWTAFFSPKHWLYMAYIGVFEMGLAFIFWQLALEKTTRVGSISSLIYLSPAISLVLINQILAEPISHFTLIGLALIMAGIGFQQYWEVKSNAKA